MCQYASSCDARVATPHAQLLQPQRMPLSLEAPTPLGYFTALVQNDADFALLEAATSLAHIEYPDLDIQSVLDEVDQLQARLRRRVPADATDLVKLRSLNQFLYGDLGFGCNVNHYYDTQNSFVHRLLETRRGIPITLAVLWMELAHGMGLSARGVGFPAHFLLKVTLPMGLAVIDPVNGQSLSREQLMERLHPYHLGRGGREESELALAYYLRTASPRQTIARMLYNLRELYHSEGQWQPLLAVHERLVVLLPEAWVEYRDRGLVHAKLGHTQQALEDLECYLAHASTDQGIGEIALQVEALRRA